MRNKWIEPVRAMCVVLPVSLVLTACMSSGAPQGQAPSGGGMFSGLFGASPAPAPVAAAAPAPVAEVECPQVEIREGGATLRQGDPKSVKVQFTIKNVARECAAAGDSVVFKVGIEGLALIGAAGKPGPASAPLTITVTRGGKVVATRATTAKVTIPADEDQAQFRMIEDGIKAPPGVGDLAVTVGFKG